MNIKVHVPVFILEQGNLNPCLQTMVIDIWLKISLIPIDTGLYFALIKLDNVICLTQAFLTFMNHSFGIWPYQT